MPIIMTYIVLINRNVYYRHDYIIKIKPSLLQEEVANRLE
jgi:hypothetical protein